MLDSVHARAAAAETQRVHRQQVGPFMLTHGRILPRKTAWGARHYRWLEEQRFDNPAHQIALQKLVDAVRTSKERIERIGAAIEEFLPGLSHDHPFPAVRANYCCPAPALRSPRPSGGDVASEIRKRLASIARSRSFVDWRKVKDLARDLETQREAIAAHVAATSPGEAFDLLWRMLEMAPSIYERCDDSNGAIGSVIEAARDDIGATAAQAGQPVGALADRVFAAACANDYGQFDELIPLTAEALGPEGLNRLKARFEELAANAPMGTIDGERRVIGLSARGPIYQDDYERGRHGRLVRSALTEMADALGDVDGSRAAIRTRNGRSPRSQRRSPSGCSRPIALPRRLRRSTRRRTAYVRAATGPTGSVCGSRC